PFQLAMFLIKYLYTSISLTTLYIFIKVVISLYLGLGVRCWVLGAGCHENTELKPESENQVFMRPDTAEEKKLIENLHSKDQTTVLETINFLRQEGKVSSIPFIIELLKNTNAGEIRNSLIAFLNDLKYQGAVSELVNDSLKSIS
ncbi:MAG: hypothetical protein KAU83_01145, partial [Bacteroidales bacterium]|nr:hypothetical protein [Bacteroidales bacterium]